LLDPLDRSHTAELASRILGRRVGPRLTGGIFERSEGVPFLVEEFAAALAAGGRLEEPGGAGQVPAGPDRPSPGNVPRARLPRPRAATRVSRAARRALELASVGGQRVDWGLGAELAGRRGLEEAIELRFLVEIDEGLAAFRHALVGEAV